MQVFWQLYQFFKLQHSYSNIAVTFEHNLNHNITDRDCQTWQQINNNTIEMTKSMLTESRSATATPLFRQELQVVWEHRVSGDKMLELVEGLMTVRCDGVVFRQ